MLGIANSVALLTTFFQYFSRTIDLDLTLMNDPLCKLIPLLGRATGQSITWIQVAITIDRYLFVAYPKRFSLVHKKLFAFGVILFIIFMSFLVNSANLWFFLSRTTTTTSVVTILNATLNTTTSRTQTVVSVSCTSDRTVTVVRDMLTNVFRVILPLVLITISNHMLVKKLRESKKRLNQNRAESMSNFATQQRNSSQFTVNNQQQHQQTNKNRKQSISRREYSFVISIVGMDYLLIITLIPVTITTLIQILFQIFPANQVLSATIGLAHSIFLYVSFFSWALSFVINLLFNRIFKKEFLNSFKNCT